MKRVLVIGGSGAGKSTLATALAEKTGLPLIHMDVVFWKPGWVETPDDEFVPRIEELAAKDAWIMEGNFSRTFPIRMPRADTIIMVTRPRWLCLLRAIWRSIKYFGRTRPDLGDGCPERLDLEFYKWIWNFPIRSVPKNLYAMASLGAHAEHVFIRSDREAAEYLESVGE